MYRKSIAQAGEGGHAADCVVGELTDVQKAWMEKEELQTILEKGLLNGDSVFSEYLRKKYPGSWVRAQNCINGGEKNE